MLGVIVLLENSLFLFYLQFFKTFHHSIFWNCTILLYIHLSFNLYKFSNSIPAHTTSYHEIISFSMLDSWCSGAIRHWLPLLFPYIYPSIWPNLIYFCFITSQYPFPVFYCPILMIFSKFKVVCMVSSFEHRNFLFHCWAKASLLQSISDCLRINMIWNDRVNEMCSLNCIIRILLRTIDLFLWTSFFNSTWINQYLSSSETQLNDRLLKVIT